MARAATSRKVRPIRENAWDFGGTPINLPEPLSDRVDAITAQMDRVSITSKKWSALKKQKDALLRQASSEFKRRNPLEAAGDLSEAFLGRPPETITEYEEMVREHAVLADLARLLYFVVWQENDLVYRLAEGGKFTDLKHGGQKIEFDAETRVASNEAGTQLYVIGGDQSVDLSLFEVDPSKESIPLGRIVCVEYFAAKHHLGKSDRTPGPYVHDFAEEWLEESKGGEVPLGVFPLLVYDAMNERLSLAGGIYHIDLDMDGETHSAGLRD